MLFSQCLGFSLRLHDHPESLVMFKNIKLYPWEVTSFGFFQQHGEEIFQAFHIEALKALVKIQHSGHIQIKNKSYKHDCIIVFILYI